MNQLEKTMCEEWEDVRKGFYYPQLPLPQLVDNIPNGYIDIESLKIKVSEQFVKELKKRGIKENESLNEVLTHEVTHFMKYPGSMLNILRLHKAGREVVDKNKATELRRQFTEAQTNIYMVKEKKHPSTIKMRRVVKPDKKDSLGNLMYGLYQEVWKKNLGIELINEERGLVKKLSDIDYLNEKEQIKNFKRFVNILKDYNPSQQREQNQQDRQDQFGQESPCPGGGISGFTDNEIREGIRQFAQECDGPQEFEKIVQEVLLENISGAKEEGIKVFDKRKIKLNDTSAGTEKGTLSLASNFYSALAENYNIPIKGKLMDKNGSLYPYSRVGFSIGDSLNDLDPFSTPGIMPGVTKKIIRKEGETFSNDESTPDELLIIDNSPSMPNPEKSTSVPVLGATVISNAYLKNDSHVAVYSFGSEDVLVDFSTNKDRIHNVLRMYSEDGGTIFDPAYVDSILKKRKNEFDVSVISDMEISNLGDFVNSILKIPQTHRIHLLYTDKQNDSVGGLKKKFGSRQNVAIIPLTKKGDIENLIMGELKKSVK